MEALKRRVDWADAICLASDSLCPADLLEEVMSAPECAPFGPVHHYLVGATLLACVRNAMGTEALPAQLAELERRSSAVPGSAAPPSHAAWRSPFFWRTPRSSPKGGATPS